MNKLSKADEHLLVRPEQGLWAEICNPLVEVGSLPGCRGAGEDGCSNDWGAPEQQVQVVSGLGLSHEMCTAT